jgi:hypothetical protein
MKTYAELGTVHRNEPCQEYPGTWMVYYKSPDENLEVGKASFEEAYTVAAKFLIKYDADVRDFPLRLSICWKCSDNDPRVGQVWFTGFYQHGKFNLFGDYKS